MNIERNLDLNIYDVLYDEIRRTYNVLGERANAQIAMEIRKWKKTYNLDDGEVSRLMEYNDQLFEWRCSKHEY